MHIQDLPLETFKLLLRHVALMLGVQPALRLRLVSKIFANEMIEALIDSGTLDEITDDSLAVYMGITGRELRVKRCPDERLKARYLYSRVQHRPSVISEIHSSESDGLKFISHLALIATKFATKSGGKYAYNTALSTLCDIVVRNYDLSIALTESILFWPDEKEYCPDQACLHIACGIGDLDLVSTLLLEDNVEVNPSEPRYFLSLPIRAAVRGGHQDIVDYLLQRGSRIEAGSMSRPAFWTVIHDSILNRDPAMLAFLLEKNLEFPLRERHTGDRHGSAYEDALITAAYQDNDIAFRTLLDRGPIKAPFPVPLQQLVLMAACEGGSISIARSIFDMNPSLDPDYDLLEFISVHRALVPSRYQRQSPLQAAAYWGSMPLIELLLDHGANPNWVNQIGDRALSRASSQGYDRCKDMLLRAGADASLDDHYSLFRFTQHKQTDSR